MGTGVIYFKARKLKDMSVIKYAKKENQTNALILLSHSQWREVTHYWRYLTLLQLDICDAFAESTIHALELTAVSGFR